MSKSLTEKPINFNELISQIQQADQHLTRIAAKAVNISLTLRNWLIGYYIAEYQLQGKDRADYGDQLFSRLADTLKELNINAVSRRQLYIYLKFYRTYTNIVRSLTTQSFGIQLPSDIDQIVRSSTAQSLPEESHLLLKLSFTHIEQLLQIEDATKRSFYALEAIQANWNVRELKRQIASLYYERAGLSHNKIELQQLSQKSSEQNPTGLVVRDPYIFEFLGLKPQEVMSESHLEGELINKLEDFMLELGHGFCFEAKQKRILIGDEYYFIDLVFYHRILKCHVLIDLKLEAFNHSNIGQLNTYVSWYKTNMMSQGDNPPIGILLCTDKNHALVEYAIAGMDNQLFVSKYQLELPKPETMQAFIEQQMQQLAQSE
jgi:predicted nuclease of restriction endonuclease-like (RecB) superfamily